MPDTAKYYGDCGRRVRHMRLLFCDVVSAVAYDPAFLAARALGGTEATVVRIAEGLSRLASIDVCVEQRSRAERARFAATYETTSGGSKFDPTHVVLLRVPSALPWIRQRFPNARHYVWLHDLIQTTPYRDGINSLLRSGATAICVSEFHKQQFVAVAASIGSAAIGAQRVRRIYNPIDDDLQPNTRPVRPDKIMFTSSPHKGLAETLKVFETFRDYSELKGVELHVANPGYLACLDTSQVRNVVSLGPLPHEAVIQHVREALCVFHYNRVVPETFGLVHAECDAVGTPFLAGDTGSNKEVMAHADECMPLDDSQAVVDRITRWHRGERPVVQGRPEFRLSTVVPQWVTMLAE